MNENKYINLYFIVILWFHVFMSVKAQMEQIRHPLTTPWVNTLPFLCMKMGGAQGFVDPTKALSKTEWFNKEWPMLQSKIASDILKPNVQRDQGMMF